jgi:hypothetical protein
MGEVPEGANSSGTGHPWPDLTAASRPIEVDASGRHFVDGFGRPFFWLGDTAWPLIAQYTRDEAERYLGDRSRKGFNVVQCVVAWGGGSGFEQSAPGPNYAGELPWLDGPAKPNPAYFDHVDCLLAYAAERGIILALLPTWGYYVNNARAIDVSSARAYGRWLGDRYRGQPNIVWVNGGDRLPTGFEEVYRALARGLLEGDHGAHLITYHPCGWRSSSQFFHQEDWLDFNMIQTWTEWAKIHPAVVADGLLWPRKPVVLAEPAYENGPEYPQGPITSLIVRREAWWAFMGGGFFTYGQDRMWRMGPGWDSTFDTPGAIQMGVFREIATSRGWWRMSPDQGLFASGVGSERLLNTALRSVDGDCAMLYLSSQCHTLVHLDKIATRQVRATLVDPRGGEARNAGIFATGNLGEGDFPEARTQWFSVPVHWEDAVLILDAVG